MATVETTPGRHPDFYAHATGDKFGKIADAPIGFGHMKRKEDARFIRGLGDYTDDVRLPGMVHGASLRSPYAHAYIKSIDTSAALAHPKVAAVVIAKDLETLGLAWMPTISQAPQAAPARASGRRGGRHRQGPRDAGPGLDADHLLRHAGRARRRQGPLPPPGGRVRHRARRLQRPGRAGAHRGGLRGG